MKCMKILAAGLMMLFAASAAAQETWTVKGEIKALHTETSSIVVKTTIMGLTGPMEKDIPYRVNAGTILNLCWNGACNSGLAVKEFSRLADFVYAEAENLSVIGKEAELEIDQMGEITRITINAPTPVYYFTPVDFISVF